MTCFVAFGANPRLPGNYLKEPFSPLDLRAYFGSRDGFWSLVRGDHATLVAMEALKTTVMNVGRFPPPADSKHPGKPSAGDEVIVVIPDEPFTEWTDESIDEIDWSGGRKIPIPSCRLERWTRLK
jgi:hypothetical protein